MWFIFFIPSEVPTLRACIQRGILIKERQLLEDSKAKTEIHVGETCKELAPLVLSQWQRSNPKFYPPVVIKGDSLVKRLDWTYLSVLLSINFVKIFVLLISISFVQSSVPLSFVKQLDWTADDSFMESSQV